MNAKSFFQVFGNLYEKHLHSINGNRLFHVLNNLHENWISNLHSVCAPFVTSFLPHGLHVGSPLALTVSAEHDSHAERSSFDI